MGLEHLPRKPPGCTSYVSPTISQGGGGIMSRRDLVYAFSNNAASIDESARAINSTLKMSYGSGHSGIVGFYDQLPS
jgi:hypothetical protein